MVPEAFTTPRLITAHHRAALWRVLLCFTLSISALIGCQSEGAASGEASEETPPPPTPIEDSPDPGVKATPAKTMDSAALLKRLAPVLPADTFLFGAIDFAAMRKSAFGQPWAFLGDHFNAPARAALEAALGEHFESISGINLARADWFAFAMNKKELLIYVGGPVADLTQMKKKTRGGVEFARSAAGVELAEVEPGVIFIGFNNRSRERFAALKSDPTTTLASDSAKLDALGGVISGLGEGYNALLAFEFSGALARELTDFAEETSLPALGKLERGVIALGPDARAQVHGPPEAHEALGKLHARLLERVTSHIEKQQALLPEMRPQQGFEFLIFAHFTLPIINALKPTVSGNSSTVSVDLGAYSEHLSVITSSAVSLFAIEFTRYVSDSKTSEAKENLKALSEGALAYFHEEHYRSDLDLQGGGSTTTARFPTEGDTPEHSQWKKCTTTGNQREEKQVPDHDDFNHHPWRAVRFEIYKPHYYEYCWEVAEADHFKIVATASLEAANDSVFAIEGKVEQGRPIISEIQMVAGEDDGATPPRRRDRYFSGPSLSFLLNETPTLSVRELCARVEELDEDRCMKTFGEMARALEPAGEWDGFSSCLAKNKTIGREAFEACVTEDLERVLMEHQRDDERHYSK